jgi:hypothetical protein
MSESRRLSNLGPLALATRDASSLREVLHVVIRYLRLHTDVFVVFFEERDDVMIYPSSKPNSSEVGSRLHAS